MGGDLKYEQGWVGGDDADTKPTSTTVLEPGTSTTTVPPETPPTIKALCQSCAEQEAEIPMLSACGIGLTVCRSCSTVLATIGWEIAQDGGHPA